MLTDDQLEALREMPWEDLVELLKAAAWTGAPVEFQRAIAEAVAERHEDVSRDPIER